jgi:glycosyltransferase involved in cell wall biosynthesis
VTRPLRVLAACDWFSPTTGGGAERVAYEVARRLSATEFELTLLVTAPSDRSTFELPPTVRIVIAPARSLARLLRAQISIAPSLPAIAGRTIREVRPDVVWAHSLQFQTTHVLAWTSRRLRLPLVVTAHIGELSALRGLLGLAARSHEATLGRFILGAAKRAIAVSEPVADHLRRLSPDLAIDTVPNGVDVGRFEARRIPHHGLRIGFLGRLVANKCPEDAVLALGDVVGRGVDASLEFMGDGPERARLERLAGETGLADRVLFHGFRPDPERWLPTIDVIVRPSLTEGMPLGLLEAMAAGVPVVASDIPGNASIVRSGENGLLVPARDRRRLADALAAIASEPALVRRLVEGGKATTASMSWDRTAELTAASLDRAAA